MEISFRRVRKANESVPIHGAVDLPRVVEENSQVRELGPISARLLAEASEHLCRVHGTLSATVTYQCSRCLEPNEQLLQTTFEEVFTDLAAKANEDIHFVPDDAIVLDAYIEQAINLAVEYCPLCADDCKGLCPVCGVNQNRASCGCELKAVDPRWAELQDLLSTDES